ncbi:MAG TPA: LysM peptidoglycan-binding domain-containing protein [Flavobacteriaceae bacterium]|nr:LysM peptidoglycan-binding domain-containing protein [Flavobacteriaceae bacterium]
MKRFVILFLAVIACNYALYAQNYQTHKVKKGETIESIAKQYLVTPYAIHQLNPDSKNELRIGSVLIIPKAIVETRETATIEKELTGFKEHKVKRKETLYSLSKKYEVEQDEIKKHNPKLYASNLKKGDLIKIPLYRKKIVINKPKEATTRYTVKPKEGKWRIAYKFGITVAELEALNPNMGETLQEGQQINVPNLETQNQKQIDEAYSYYTVLPKEGFYRLKLKLGLEQEQLEKLNPELKESGLKEGMVLKIPHQANPDTTAKTVYATSLESKIKPNTQQKHLAVMLPFRLNRVQMDSIQDTKQQIIHDPYLSNALDFYSGMVVAFDSLQKLGISLKVDVHDTQNEKSRVAGILRKGNLDTVDAVIGPLLSENFKLVASGLKDANVPVISPLGKDLELYSNVFQSRPDDKLLQAKVLNYVKNNQNNSHTIVIADAKNSATRDMLKREFPTASLVNSRKNKSGEDQYYVTLADIENALRQGKNTIFMETESAGFVSNVTSILNSKQNKDTEITLTTTNFNKAFESDEVSNHDLSNLHFTYATIARFNTEEGSNGFVNRYSEAFGETPGKMATRGFDLTMDVVLRLVTSDNLYTSAKDDELTQYVENKFQYKKKLFGGYYNDSVYLVKYQNLQIVEISD